VDESGSVDETTGMLGLEHEMTYRLRVTGPLSRTTGSPTGEREYWEMTEGALTGPRISARIARPGGDWMAVGEDGYNRPDVRVQLVTDDDAMVLLHYTGLVQPTERFQRAAEAGEETDWGDQYMRMVFQFETGAARYLWLMQSIFIAQGRLAGPATIEYRVYKLS
jgi:Protein of unknown function (DUF3237)